MAWTLFPVPTSAPLHSPAVRLTDNTSGKRLCVNAAALAASGLKGRDELVIERDDERPHLCRVRRRAEGEPAFGTLCKPTSERSGIFSAAGSALYQAGYRAGAVGATCGEGWVAFDAQALLAKPDAPAVLPPKTGAIVPAAPAAPSTSKATAETPKPWPVESAPEIAMRAIRMVVEGAPAQRIKDELGVEVRELANVRLLVGEPQIARLKGKGAVEREEYFAETLPKWRARFENRGGVA